MTRKGVKRKRQELDELSTGLKKSKDELGMPPFYPILKAPDGSLIDGAHRQLAGFSEEKVVEWAHTPKEKLLAKAYANYRRNVTQLDMQKIVEDLAKILGGWGEGVPEQKISSEISRLLPRRFISERYVRKLLPKEYKQKGKVREGKFAELVPQNDSQTSP